MERNNANGPTRRRDTRKAERRAEIVAIATTHFLMRGYDRTSMSAIVEEMGGSKGTLWSYFASKEMLFAAVLDAATAPFRATMHTALDPAGDLQTILSNFAEKFIVRISDSEGIAFQRLVISEAERLPAIGRIFYDRARAVTRSLLSDYLVDQMSMGSLRKDDEVEAANMFLDLCAGGYHQRILWGLEVCDAGAVKSEASRIVKQFLRCYPPMPAHADLPG